MAKPPAKSVIVTGGGIVGLCIAVAAQAAGHKVTLIARDRPQDTASGVAAGMIAPALEAMNDPDPRLSFERLSHAQAAWAEMPADGAATMRTYALFTAAPTYFLFQPGDDIAALRATGADLVSADAAERRFYGLSPDTEAVRVAGDWALPAQAMLERLLAQFTAFGGVVRDGDVETVTRTRVRLRSGPWIDGDEVILATGFDGRALKRQVPSLKILTPIKGHLLDMPAHNSFYGVLRSREGYLAFTSGVTKFGATMQTGQDDLRVEADIVADLKARAQAMLPDLAGLDKAVPRVGIRAASPDGWPMIGRDAASGVLVATAMRRNGYVFAPLAARMMLDFLKGEIPPEAVQYDPNRFS